MASTTAKPERVSKALAEALADRVFKAIQKITGGRSAVVPQKVRKTAKFKQLAQLYKRRAELNQAINELEEALNEEYKVDFYEEGDSIKIYYRPERPGIKRLLGEVLHANRVENIEASAIVDHLLKKYL